MTEQRGTQGVKAEQDSRPGALSMNPSGRDVGGTVRGKAELVLGHRASNSSLG